MMIPLAARYADRVITISQNTARDLLRLVETPGLAAKTHPIHLAVNPAFRPIPDRAAITNVCRRFGLTPGNFILSVGVLEPRKNLPVLLRAYRRLRDEGFAHSLAIVGKRGWMFSSILAAVEALHLEDHVVFTDHLSDTDLPYVYNGAAVFVYPSIYEGFGLPALEALACGTPVVTSDVSSLPEIVGQAGLLVPPSDAGVLFDALKRILSEPELAASLAQQGTERAAQFSWQRTACETLAVYESAIRGER
jgi:glycosyltransferase involved in cell wall biosynthesis